MTEQKEIPREPIVGGLVISKIDAAERQLTTAIWLWFHDFDPVPIHALACAALKILWRLHQKHATGHQTLREGLLDSIQPEYQKAAISLLNETENFIKHADRDPMDFHTFKPESTNLVIFDAVTSLQALNGRMPIEAQAFIAWFFIHYPTLVKAANTPLEKSMDAARRYTINTPKAELYKLICEAALLNKQRAAAEHAAASQRGQ